MDKLVLTIDDVSVTIDKEIYYENFKGPLPDIIDGMIRPALRAHGFDDKDINRRFVRSAENNELEFVTAVPAPQSNNVSIAFQDAQGNPLMDTDGVTQVEVSLDQDDFIALLNKATNLGLSFDKYINKVLDEQLKKMIADKEEAHGGCE